MKQLRFSSQFEFQKKTDYESNKKKQMREKGVKKLRDKTEAFLSLIIFEKRVERKNLKQNKCFNLPQNVLGIRTNTSLVCRFRKINFGP